MCYTLEGFKQLLLIDAEFTACQERVRVLMDRDRLFNAALQEMAEAYRLTHISLEALKEENKRLFEEWKKENELRHKAENSPRVETWVAWGVAGLALAVAGGAVTYAVLD